MTPDKSIEDIIGKSWEKINHELYDRGGVNPYAYRLGFLDGYKQKDERIKKLKEELGKSIEIIKQWHNADEVWDIYFNNAPEMKSIRELLNNH